MELRKIQAFTHSDIELLNEYNVLTVDQFLGVTFGLTKENILSLLQNKEAVVQEIKSLFNNDELSKYQEVNELPVTGLIIRSNNQ